MQKDLARRRGIAAEHFAEQFLRAQGLRLLARNFRCKLGEIDLVMQQGATVIFVEVRLRTHQAFAQAAETVTLQKQRKLQKAAAVFLQTHQLNCPCRFDVVALSLNPKTGYDADWIQNAFLDPDF